MSVCLQPPARRCDQGTASAGLPQQAPARCRQALCIVFHGQHSLPCCSQQPLSAPISLSAHSGISASCCYHYSANSTTQTWPHVTAYALPVCQKQRCSSSGQLRPVLAQAASSTVHGRQCSATGSEKGPALTGVTLLKCRSPNLRIWWTSLTTSEQPATLWECLSRCCRQRLLHMLNQLLAWLR